MTKISDDRWDILRAEVEETYAGGIDARVRCPRGIPHDAAAPRVWVAYWSAAVGENKWEPFDQPSPAAYIPFSFSDVLRRPLVEGGDVLVRIVRRKHPDYFHAPRVTKRVDVLRPTIEDVFSRAGAPPSALATAMEILAVHRIE